MLFGLSEEISEDVIDKADAISRMSQELQAHFKDKTFGTGLDSLAIGIICVAPEFEFFFKEKRRTYTKSKKSLEYDVRLDHAAFKASDRARIERMVVEAVMASLPAAVGATLIADFDADAFIMEAERFFSAYG